MELTRIPTRGMLKPQHDTAGYNNGVELTRIPDHLIVNIASKCPHVWSCLFLTCKRFAGLLSKENKKWESTFLEVSESDDSVVYRFKGGLKYQFMVHRFGNPAVHILRYNKIKGLAYFWKSDRHVKEICVPVSAFGEATMYAEYGLLHRLDGPALLTREGTFNAIRGLTCARIWDTIGPSKRTTIDLRKSELQLPVLASVMQRLLLLANHPILYVIQLSIEMILYILIVKYRIRGVKGPLTFHVYVTLLALIAEAY